MLARRSHGAREGLAQWSTRFSDRPTRSLLGALKTLHIMKNKGQNEEVGTCEMTCTCVETFLSLKDKVVDETHVSCEE